VESAIGKELRLGGGRWRPIVGVVKDFHSHSAHSDHEPLVMAPKKIFYSDIGIKIRPENISRTVEAVRKVYDETFPEQVFKSEFYDESIANFYQLEARFSDFSKGVAALAILIGCLGLFGLATHAASRRTKEIGVRKSLGASVFNITALLTIDFLKLVLVAILIAVPVSYYLMQKWLSDFVFRIQLEWWMFAVSCLGAIAVAFLTVSYQSIRAALANPVDSLRSE
jgi:ABC-type antimicrobial peptide transport system permease subunit